MAPPCQNLPSDHQTISRLVNQSTQLLHGSPEEQDEISPEAPVHGRQGRQRAAATPSSVNVKCGKV